MNTIVRLGLAGCGSAFAADRAELAKDSTYRVVALWDRDATLAKEAAKAFEAAIICASYDELLARTDVDAVVVTTSSTERAALACEALKAGKHVLCEGCSGRSIEEVDVIAETARTAQRVAFFHASRLRSGGFTHLARSYVTAEKFGRVYRVEAVLHRGTRDHTGPFDPREMLQDAGAHVLDQALDLIGWPKLEALSAQVLSMDGGGEHACIYARLKGGIAFSLDVAVSDNLRPKHALTILGDRAGLVIDHTKGGRGFSFVEELPGMRTKLMESKPFFSFDAWGNGFRTFHEQMAGKTNADATTPTQARELACWISLARIAASEQREVQNPSEKLEAVS